ncbi:unnamed protein product [Cylindrotheca closterium]|uniref:DUF6824 domain-containing protein n=1 Tax=Cylindrotheca closterium TaxID=2856 RepID=A0AAD2FRV7_9STRA|nr:unnamed protein product [Cylindrotheca closterium]
MFNRKKQRRQAAAGVVQSMIGGNHLPTNNHASAAAAKEASARKSTAQPRPDIVIPPRGIGPIADPNDNDVLCGRGGRINSHVGNRQFREIIASHKKDYLAPTTKKLEKAHIAAAIVNDIRSMQPAGRFLKEDGKSGMWYDIGDAKAIKKTGQALREDAPDIRPEIDGESVVTETAPAATTATTTTTTTASKSPSSSKPTQKSPIVPKMVNGAAASSPSPSPRNCSSSSTRTTSGTAFDAHGPQLLPEGRRNTVDQQGRAAMPPPFHQFNPPQQANNPYLKHYSQGTSGPPQTYSGSFPARSIPIQAPQSVSADYIHEVQQQQALLLPHVEENAFGRPFHPPESAIGSEGTMSSISGLTDPVRSTMSGSGMNGGGTNSTRSPARVTSGFANGNGNNGGSRHYQYAGAHPYAAASAHHHHHHHPYAPRSSSNSGFQPPQQQQQQHHHPAAAAAEYHQQSKHQNSSSNNSFSHARFNDVNSYMQMSLGGETCPWGWIVCGGGGSSIARSPSFPARERFVFQRHGQHGGQHQQ